jgi:7,8-didemethyl-8-hydroxy-5-deazariboflavin synthase CofG subunit
MAHIQEELGRRGYGDFWEFAAAVADRCGEAGLFPHGNFGRMTEEELRRLRPHFISMGMMLESVEDEIRLAPEKKVAGRVAGIEAAGRAKVPFTSGILVGWGESQTSRLRSLRVLADLQKRYGHLQEILIQRYVPNEGSRWPAGQEPTLEEYGEMMGSWREWAPEVAIQIPPNLEPRWLEMVEELDDLGGISWARDEVNPTRPWAEVERYREGCGRAGRELVERLPVYESHATSEWLDPIWQKRVEDFIGPGER